MTPLHSSRRTATLTGSRLTTPRAREGVVTGYLFKVIRERIPLTQEGIAEGLGVDKSTVQGWESGRRPLSATKAGTLLVIRRKLLRLGGDPALLELLDTAMRADHVLDYVLSLDAQHLSVDDHPLSHWVFTRDVAHMLAWALTGTAPSALASTSTAAVTRRRGPVAESPMLGRSERSTFFAHLRHAAEMAAGAGAGGALLRRQACYLSSYDRSPDASAWLADMHRAACRAPLGSWSPLWSTTRSVTTSIARQGDRQPLIDFIAHNLDDDAGNTANLNYWAYWMGIDKQPKCDDSFMTGRLITPWHAGALLTQFADRLDDTWGYIDLYVHSVWALAMLRGVLYADPALNRRLTLKVTALLDGSSVSAQSRRELEAVHYGLRLSAD